MKDIIWAFTIERVQNMVIFVNVYVKYIRKPQQKLIFIDDNLSN
jgi:hypothetical protein